MAEADLRQLLVFRLDEQRIALRLELVERVVRMVEVTPLPEAPDIVTGVINVQGIVTPVFDLRRRFCLPGRGVRLTDQLVIARADRRRVAVVVDEVMGVDDQPDREVVASDSILPDLNHVEGVVKLPDGLVFIHNLNTFLSIGEAAMLECALSGPASRSS